MGSASGREQGYKLLNQYYTKYNKDDPELYIFNYTFGYAFKKIMANRYRLDVVLPPGAKEVNVSMRQKPRD